MTPALISMLISLFSGAAGGNVAAALFKNINMGTLWNSVAGIAGGGIGGTLLSMLVPGMAGGAGGLDIGSILGQVAGGGIGGGGLLAIVSMLRSAMAK